MSHPPVRILLPPSIHSIGYRPYSPQQPSNSGKIRIYTRPSMSRASSANSVTSSSTARTHKRPLIITLHPHSQPPSSLATSPPPAPLPPSKPSRERRVYDDLSSSFSASPYSTDLDYTFHRYSGESGRASRRRSSTMSSSSAASAASSSTTKRSSVSSDSSAASDASEISSLGYSYGSTPIPALSPSSSQSTAVRQRRRALKPPPKYVSVHQDLALPLPPGYSSLVEYGYGYGYGSETGAVDWHALVQEEREKQKAWSAVPQKRRVRFADI